MDWPGLVPARLGKKKWCEDFEMHGNLRNDFTKLNIGYYWA